MPSVTYLILGNQWVPSIGLPVVNLRTCRAHSRLSSLTSLSLLFGTRCSAHRSCRPKHPRHRPRSVCECTRHSLSRSHLFAWQYLRWPKWRPPSTMPLHHRHHRLEKELCRRRQSQRTTMNSPKTAMQIVMLFRGHFTYRVDRSRPPHSHSREARAIKVLGQRAHNVMWSEPQQGSTIGHH